MTNDYLNLMAQLQASIDEVRSMMPVGDDQTTSVEYTPGGAIITAIDNSPPESESVGGDTYNGQFKVTAGEGENTVDISAGQVINGTESVPVAAQTGFDVSTNDFLYLEISYGTSYTIEYAAGTTYPDQDNKDDKWCIRFLIAEKVDDTWEQRRYQEIHNTRSVE